MSSAVFEDSSDTWHMDDGTTEELKPIILPTKDSFSRKVGYIKRVEWEECYKISLTVKRFALEDFA